MARRQQWPEDSSGQQWPEDSSGQKTAVARRQQWPGDSSGQETAVAKRQQWPVDNLPTSKIFPWTEKQVGAGKLNVLPTQGKAAHLCFKQAKPKL